MKYERTKLHPWGVVVVIAFGVAGCSPRTPATRVAPPTSASGSTVDQVCEIAAELLGVDRSKVHAETSLGDLGADELDFVELVMELEEHFDILIPDETAERMMGTANWQQGIENVTMAKLAAVVEDRKQVRGAGAQQSPAPEPAAGPVSDGGSSPPAR